MQLSILQWNIWYKEKVENIAEFLEHYKADIVCLQELTIESSNQTVADTPKYIADKLGYGYHHQEIPIKSPDGKKITIANGIFSRFPITTRRSSWINKPVSSGGYEDEYRAYVEVGLKAEGKFLEVGTSHMSYTDRFIDTLRKKKEASLLAKILKTKKTSYIFTGDLNSQPDSFTVRELNKHLKHAGPAFGQNTWTTKPFSYRGFEASKLNWRLDYIFTSKDIGIVSSEIIETNYSDHLPILARLKVN